MPSNLKPFLALSAAIPAMLGLQGVLAHEPKQVESVMVDREIVAISELVDDLDDPWGMTFLPDGRMLVTEKAGNLLRFSSDGEEMTAIEGTPAVHAQGQGGLMDVALHPQFAQNRLVYIAFAEPGAGDTAGTALGRGRLEGDRLEDFEVIWRQEPKVSGNNHFGNRIVFAPDGKLFLTLGERFKFQPAQDLSNTLGVVVRLNDDGSIPRDNPFVGRSDAADAIWSYGHRNIEAAAIHPDSGDLWVMEMGPLGGDELNRVERGANYGWPVVSWGINYNGVDIPDPTRFPQYEDAVHHWSPVRSPSGMIFYTGDRFPGWRGDILFGSLSAGGVELVDMEGDRFEGSQFIPLNTRIREVEQGPSGYVFLLTNGDGSDAGAIWRMENMPVRPPSADGDRTGAGAR